MDLSLREQFARLGPTRVIDRVTCGSPAVFIVTLPADHGDLRTIDAIRVLVRRGIAVSKAKRAVEAVLEFGPTTVALPTVEDESAVVSELAQAGFSAVPQAADYAQQPPLARKSA